MKNKCQFCGVEKKRIIEKFIKHEFFGLVCPDCQNGSHFQKVLKLYNEKKEKKSL
jgi:hypothetical protein